MLYDYVDFLTQTNDFVFLDNNTEITKITNTIHKKQKFTKIYPRGCFPLFRKIKCVKKTIGKFEPIYSRRFKKSQLVLSVVFFTHNVATFGYIRIKLTACIKETHGQVQYSSGQFDGKFTQLFSHHLSIPGTMRNFFVATHTWALK